MPKKKYTIVKSDLLFARRWIDNKFNAKDYKSFSVYMRNRQCVDFALQEYQEVDFRATTKLNEWCEKFLTSKDWSKLKTSIRAGRNRKDKGNRKSIDIDFEAWCKLSAISDSESLTISEIINKYLNKQYLVALESDAKLQTTIFD